MLKKLIFLSVCTVSQPLLAAHEITLRDAPLNSLKKFLIVETRLQNNTKLLHSNAEINTLEFINKTPLAYQTISRYQQKYHGITVRGAEIIITRPQNMGKNLMTHPKTLVNGQLIEDIQIDTKPTVKAQDAIALAKTTWLAQKPDYQIQEAESQLELRPDSQDNLQLVHVVSFKGIKNNSMPAWPFFIIDAHSGKILQQWNNIKHFKDTGPGGNDKVHQYWYGQDDLPTLQVTEDKNGLCVMNDEHVKLVDLDSRWDEAVRYKVAYKYTCGQNQGDPVNGAFSPNNDAWFFGHLIVDMYQNWYELPALQTRRGTPMQLVMRTHFGTNFDNAFWYRNTMNFGDGQMLYPLVTMDIAGHEVSHGFTQQHSGLEYHDQPGSLNESFSDMAGQAVRAYALEHYPALYNRAHITPDIVNWKLAEAVMRSPDMPALRYMDQPSQDDRSADCLHRMVAASYGATCNISYQDVVDFATQVIEDPQEAQSYIVHTGSGVFNKAFYLMSENMGIKEAFNIMVEANLRAWKSTDQFDKAACDVVRIAGERDHDVAFMHTVFGQVGIDTSNNCTV